MLIPSWLIISGVVVIIFVLLFKSMNNIYVLSWVKDNFFWFFLIGLLLFFTFSLSRVSNNYHLDFSTADGLKNAGKVYLGWLGTLMSNIGKVSGYVVSQDWTKINLNSTNITGMK